MSLVVNPDWKQWIHLSPTKNRASIRLKGLLPSSRVISRPRKVWLTMPRFLRKVYWHLMEHHGRQPFDVWVVKLRADVNLYTWSAWAWRTPEVVPPDQLLLLGLADPDDSSGVLKII